DGMVRHLQPDKRPSAGNDAPDVVAAAAYGDPPAAGMPMGEFMDEGRHRRIDGHAAMDMRQRIIGMGVAAVLAYNNIGLERSGGLLDGLSEAFEPGIIFRVRLDRHIHRAAESFRIAAFVYEACAGE